MTEKVALNITKKTDHDFDPFLMMQTGYGVLHLHVTQMPMQSDVGIASVGDVNHADFLDNITEFQKAGSANSTFPEIEDGTQLPIVRILERMTAAAWTCIRSVVYNGTWLTWPTWVADVVGDGPQIFRAAYEQFKRGVFRRDPIAWSDSFTSNFPGTAANADQVTEGLSWSATHPFQMISRLAYIFGLSMADKFPDLSVRIEATNNDTVLERNLQALYLLFPPTMLDFYYLGAAQSDVGMFSIANLQEGLVSKKVPSDIFNSVDQAWLEFVKTSKYDVLGANMKNAGGTQVLKTYVSDFIDDTLVEGTDIDTAIDNWKTKYMVCNWSLKQARSMFGVGKYEKNGEQVHFANLLSGAVQDTNYADHLDQDGEPHWYLGINLAILYDYLENKKDLVRDYLLFTKKKSYTWTDITSIYDGWFTEFSVIGGLSGYAEPEKYKQIRRMETFISTEVPDTTYGWRQDCDSNVVTTLFATSTPTLTISTMLEVPSEWGYLFASQYVPNKYRFYMPYDWDEKEIYNALLLGLLFDTAETLPTGDIDKDTVSYAFQALRLVQIINCKVPDEVLCLAFGYNTQTPKWEDVADVLDYDNYSDTCQKYAVLLVDRAPTTMRFYYQHRPKGWKDIPHVFVDDVGHRDVAQQLLMNAFALQNSGKKSTTIPKGQDPNKELDSNSEGDNADGSEA
jgi:hypothetical protein